MRLCTRIGIVVITLTAAAAGADRAVLTGRVADAAGKPIDHATVMVYHAGVKKGYSMFCPSCYADCGKRTLSTADGSFHFDGLDPDLWFELLVVRDGYAPEFVKHVDPAQGPAEPAMLNPRRAVDDPARVVRGRLVNAHGNPVRDAVVQPLGIAYEKGAIYGTIDGADPVAVSNSNGDFEIAYSAPTAWMLLTVEARGLAPKLFNKVATGLERHTLTLTDGAVVRGRLVQDGKPVGGVEVGLIPQERGMTPDDAHMGNPYDEIRVGTQPDGTFAIANVPKGISWYLYGKMESLRTRGATSSVECVTKDDGEEVDLRDIPVKPEFHLRGRVQLSDGRPVAQGMRITISSDAGKGHAWDSQTVLLNPDGRFEVAGLRPDVYSLFASVKGYGISGNPLGTVEVRVERDVDDFTMTLAPRN